MMLVVFREGYGILRFVLDHVGLKIHKDGNQHQSSTKLEQDSVLSVPT